MTEQLSNAYKASSSFLLDYARILQQNGVYSSEAKAFYKQHKTNKKFRRLAKILDVLFLNRDEIISSN